MRSFLPKISLFLALFLGFSFLSQAQNFVYEENSQTHGFKIQSSTKSNVKLSHSVYNFQLQDVEIEGEAMKQLQYGLSVVPANEGTPDLRGVARYVLIPNGADVDVHITHQDKVVYENVEIAPAAAIPFDTEEALPAVKGTAYQKDVFFPGKIAQAQTTEVRGMTMAVVNINPFQYNPITKELVVYKNLEVELEINGGNGIYGENRFRSRYWDQILDDLVANTQDIPQIDYSKTAKSTTDTDGCEYLVIVPNNADFLPWADSIKLFRTEQGIQTRVVTLDEVGGNTLDNIKNYIDNVYETWDPVPSGVLLMADYGTDANTITSKSYPHPYSGNFITDNYYADYTGNDLPDFVFARMTGRNYAEMETMVTKFLDYERTPPTNSDFYDKPITALGWQTERWFQICSEAVGGYMKNVLGKNPVRINAVYGGNPNSDPWSTATNTSEVVNYFGPMGQSYIPATPGELGGWTGGSASDVVNAINDGAFILQHRDHGAESGWGEPDFSSSHIDQLNNVGELSHIFSINCLTGRFDVSGECFAEKFHRYTNGGALSLTAASQVSYSFVNDAFVWGMYDNMWPDFMPDYGGNQIEEREFRPAFGSASGKYFLSYTNWPYNTDSKQITYRLFHHHGDAFNIVYTEVPEEMVVDYAEVMISGPDFIEAQAEEGAMIAFSVDGVLIGSAEATGGMQSINIEAQIPGTIIKVVITKQNYFRHEGFITVIAPEGPYIVKSGLGIVDVDGNSNNVIDFGEDITLDFAVKNLGTDVASSVEVTISTEDEYVTLSDATESYGDVDVDEEVNHTDAFAFTMDEMIPDNHTVSFSFTATNGSDVWESSFSVKAYAPVLEVQNMTITEDGGNGNGRIDAGETATLSIEVANNGRSATPEGLAELTTGSAYLTIDTDEFEFTSIDSLGIVVAEFVVTAADDTPIGTVITITNDVEAGPYVATKDFAFSVGLIVEDWETGGFTSFPWTNTGNAIWVVDNMVFYEGTNSVRSGDIGDNQASTLTLDYSVMVDDEISFFVKVSSESGYDFLKFYIDNTSVGSWAGEVDWTEVSFPVTAGDHTFKWEYSKDVSMDSGQDCAWVDFIVLPPMMVATANAGSDMEVCEGETSLQLAGAAQNYNTLEWSTAGDGSFSSTSILDPVYYLGSNDINNGGVELTLLAIGEGSQASNTMNVDITTAPNQPAIPQGDESVCYMAEDMVYTLVEDTDTYEFIIAPEDAATVSVVANTATLSFNDGFTGVVTLSAKASNSCGESAVSEGLEITVNEQATVAFNADASICAGEEAVLSLNLSGTAPWTVELMDEDSGEITLTADATPFEFTVNPSETMTYTLMNISDANSCTGLAEGTATVTVNAIPTAEILSSDIEVCAGETIEVDLALTGMAPWTVTLSDGGSNTEDYTINNANETVEFVALSENFDLQIAELNDSNCEGTTSGNMAVTIAATPDVDLGADSIVCNTIIYPLDAANPGCTYAWSTGEETQTIEVDESMANAAGILTVSVDVSNTTGCVGTDEITIEFKDCTGIDELNAQEIQILPNPNNGLFKLELTAIAQSDIKIYNSVGELVLEINKSQVENQMSIDLRHLADGVYFLQYSDDKNTLNKRFVIRK